jgi:hypothetical protein
MSGGGMHATYEMIETDYADLHKPDARIAAQM